MAKQRDLIKALEMLTEGAKAELPKSFATEAVMTHAAKIQKKSKPWTVGRGIQGLGIGAKISDGKQLRDLVLKVYVDEKKPKKKIKNAVPSKINMPDLDTLYTDVEEIGRVEMEVFRSRVRPAMPGCGLGHIDVTVGTFGCVVRKEPDDGCRYILSNSHVLANSGLASLGDKIIQPGDADGGKFPKDLLAHLEEFLPFDFSTSGFPNLVDAAIALPLRANLIDDKIRIVNIKPKGSSKTIKRGMNVWKVGRTTDFTTGQVRDMHFRTALRYRNPTPSNPNRRSRAGFKDQVLCTRYTQGGDSGSAVMNDKNQVVGLHFAGSESSSIFNKISNVEQLLGIKVPE